MIRFDPSQISIQILKLKSTTTALGGSIRVLDEQNSNGKNEVFKKLDAPLAVVRDFQKRYKTSKYIQAVDTAVVFYGDDIVALERHPLGGMEQNEDNNELHKKYHIRKDSKGQWKPLTAINLEEFVVPLVTSHDWYFDGRYAYHFYGFSPRQVINSDQYAEWMSSDGRFRSIQVLSLDLGKIHDRQKITPSERYCMAYVTPTGEFGITPPVWKTLGRLQNLVDSDDGSTMYKFDDIDRYWAVNLNFTLTAAKSISSIFGFESIEPLELPRLMLELRTVNLPRILKETKKFHDAGIKFSHTMAWLIGLSSQLDDLQDFMRIRALIKYLSSKGIFHRHTMSEQNIFKANSSTNDVPVLSLEDAIRSANEQSKIPVDLI